jgi:hypothetical protein
LMTDVIHEARNGSLFHASNEIMAVVTHDLALLRYHAVAALGTGVEKLLGFTGVGILPGDLA